LENGYAARLGLSKEKKKEMTLCGLGLFEIAAGLSLIAYIWYNSYMLWKGSTGDQDYGEDQ